MHNIKAIMTLTFWRAIGSSARPDPMVNRVMIKHMVYMAAAALLAKA